MAESETERLRKERDRARALVQATVEEGYQHISDPTPTMRWDDDGWLILTLHDLTVRAHVVDGRSVETPI